MDKAVFLGLAEDLQRLLLCDVLAALRLNDVGRHVAHGDAPALGVVTAALAEVLLARAAGAHALGILAFVLIEPVGDLLQPDGLLLRLDGLLHGDDVHADARAARRNHGGDLLEREERHPLEEGRDLRVLVHLAAAHVEKLRAARHKLRQDIALFVVRILAVEVFPIVLDQARPRHVVEELLQRLALHLRQLHQLLDRLRLAHAHLERDIRHLVGHHRRKAPVLGVVALHALELHRHAVGDGLDELCDLFTGLIRHGDREIQLFLLQREGCRAVAIDVLSHALSPLSAS